MRPRGMPQLTLPPAASAPKAAVAHNSEADELVEKELKDFDMRSRVCPATRRGPLPIRPACGPAAATCATDALTPAQCTDPARA